VPAKPTTQHDRRYLIRRDNDHAPGINRDDLSLLMESYRNTIELTTTLLQRQDKLNIALEEVARQLTVLASSQTDVNAGIGRLPGVFDEMINVLCVGVAGRIEVLSKTIDGNRKEETAEHNAHTLRLYVAYGVLCTIILALIGLGIKIWP
jgi:hypothetical protein